MKTSYLFRNSLKMALVTGSLFFASCGSDNSVLENPEGEPLEPGIATVTVNPTNVNNTDETQYSTTATAGSTVTVSVNFSVDSSERNMERLYITKSELNSTEGPVPYDITLGGAIEGISTKSDGSIDLDKSHKESFSFSIDFPAPETANGTVQYVIWATKQRGDFRDLTNDNVYGDETPNYAVITIGEGQPVGYVEFSQTILAAPLADLSSKTFISVFNGETYAIKEGNETAALWDFGFVNYKTLGASFRSTQNYSKNFKFFGTTLNDKGECTGDCTQSISDISKIEENELNNFYFVSIENTTLNFEDIKSASDIDALDISTTSEVISNLKIGDVIGFVDQYGNKGLIKITDLNDSLGSDGKITFSIKAQSKIIPLKN